MVYYWSITYRKSTFFLKKRSTTIIQFNRCAPTIYFKILRPSKFTTTLRTIAAALKSLLAKFQPSLCNDVPAWVLKILYRVNILMVRTEFYSWSESTAYVTVSVPAKYCNYLFYGTVDGIHIHFFLFDYVSMGPSTRLWRTARCCRWVHRVDGSIVSMGSIDAALTNCSEYY